MKVRFATAPGGFVMECVAEDSADLVLFRSVWENRGKFARSPKVLSLVTGGKNQAVLRVFFASPFFIEQPDPPWCFTGTEAVPLRHALEKMTRA